MSAAVSPYWAMSFLSFVTAAADSACLAASASRSSFVISARICL